MRDVYAVEVALALPPGELSSMLGFLPATESNRKAIELRTLIEQSGLVDPSAAP